MADHYGLSLKLVVSHASHISSTPTNLPDSIASNLLLKIL